MNDTTRDELREQVAKITDDLALSTADHERDGMLTSEYLSELQSSVDRIIALVTAARDAEIREALLSDMALVAVENARLAQENTREIVEMQVAYIMSDAAIGLGDGTGGQG